MDEEAVISYITGTFDRVETTTAWGNIFFIYDQDQKMPFATLVTGDDDYDSFSDLDRPGVFRLSVGVSRETFRALFGAPPAPGSGEDLPGDHDYTELDRLMPHPIYSRQHWVCVLSPSAATFAREVQPLLAEAYALAAARNARRAARG